MDWNHMNNVYFIGIGGIGMSALARYFISIGKIVYGYDKTPSPITNALIEEGASVHFDENESIIENFSKEDTLVIYTPAIPKTHKELIAFQKNNFELIKRAKALGMISENSINYGVAGTHGKTTISSLLAHLLIEGNIKVNAFLGGIAYNFNSNLALCDGANISLMEADEFDRSFLNLTPKGVLISSIDADHLDIYGNKEEIQRTYGEFADKTPLDGFLILQEHVAKEIKYNTTAKVYTYGLSKNADYQAINLRLEKDKFLFDIVDTLNKKTYAIETSLMGIHNAENATGAFAFAKEVGVEIDKIIQGLASFKGVKRRFEKHVAKQKVVYIDDYAHHPTEIKSLISSVRFIYPGKKLIGIFQPHLFSRTQDFMAEFAEELSKLDELWLLDIYPARELPIEGVTSQVLLNMITLENKKIVKKEDIVKATSSVEGVLLTIGAGDIDRLIEPIKNNLNEASC